MNIVFLSIAPWKFLWSRPQQIVSRLVDRGHNIVFFQSPIYLGPFALTRNYKVNGIFAIKKIMKNLYLVNIFVPPFLGKLEFVTEQLGLLVFKTYLKCLNFKPDVAIFYSYPYAFLLDTLKAMNIKTLYDCPDEFSEFSDANVSKVLKAEEKLSVKCSLVIAVSRKLCDKISKVNSNCFYVPNAADFAHFYRARYTKDKPREIANLQHPIIGFIGAIYDWINVDLICKLAESHPNYSILIVGPVKYGLNKLKKHSNIVMVGAKKYQILPQYLACMDVCLIPFKINKLTLASNPIKLYEYLAAGKSVVSTALPEVCNNASEFVYVGKNEEDFIRKVEEAVEEPKKPEYEAMVARRVRFAEDNSWEKRIDVFERLLRQTLQSH